MGLKFQKLLANNTVLVVAIAVFGFLAQEAVGEEYIPGYVTQSGGKPVRGGKGQCWRTGSWKPELATQECDPEIYARFHPEPAPEPEPEPVVFDVQETLDAKTLFGFDDANLDPTAIEVLEDLSDRLNKFEKIQRVRVTGHTDRIGSPEYNMKLSSKRAEAVEAYLRENTNIPADMFEMEGLGSGNPVVDCEKLRGSALIECLRPNRRVEVEIMAERTETRPATH